MLVCFGLCLTIAAVLGYDFLLSLEDYNVLLNVSEELHCGNFQNHLTSTEISQKTLGIAQLF